MRPFCLEKNECIMRDASSRLLSPIYSQSLHKSGRTARDRPNRSVPKSRDRAEHSSMFREQLMHQEQETSSCTRNNREASSAAVWRQNRSRRMYSKVNTILIGHTVALILPHHIQKVRKASRCQLFHMKSGIPSCQIAFSELRLSESDVQEDASRLENTIERESLSCKQSVSLSYLTATPRPPPYCNCSQSLLAGSLRFVRPICACDLLRTYPDIMFDRHHSIHGGFVYCDIKRLGWKL